jgi:uncharacterized membrane protein
MNGNPRVPASPGGRSDAPTVIGDGCAQILLPRKGKRPTIVRITPSIWGMSLRDVINTPAAALLEMTVFDDATAKGDRYMSDLMVVAFPTEEKAEEVRKKLLDMQQEYLIELGDAVIAVKQPNGHVKLNQLFHPTASGAAYGALWGTLIGMIFLMPLAGAALGAAGGALGGVLTDVGINDQFMKDAAQTLQSGNAALFLLIRKMTTDKVLAALQGVGGTVLRTSFDHTKEEALRQALAAHTAANPAS